MPLQCLGVGDIMGRARAELGSGAGDDDPDVMVSTPLGPLGPTVTMTAHQPTPWWVWAALLYIVMKKRRR